MVAEQVQQFVSCLYEPDDVVEVRALKNGAACKFWYRARHLTAVVPDLERLNRDAWNVYVGVNPRKAEGLSADENVAACRALVADFDHIEATDGLSPSEIVLSIIENRGLPVPSMTIFSGHGIHVYWRLSEPMTPDKWRDLQVRLNACLGSDSTIRNPERIMRLPGFVNVKDASKPADCFIVYADKDLIYPLADIEAHLPEIKPAAVTAQPVHVKPDGYAERKARGTLYGLKWEGVTLGERNQAAFRHSASMLRDFELADGDAWEIVGSWNSRNDPPLDERELRQAFGDAKKYAKGAVGSKAVSKPACIRRSEPARPYPLADYRQRQAAIIRGEIRCVPWPFGELTRLTWAFLPGRVTILVGSKGAAKSFFRLQCQRFWLDTSETVAAYLLEGSLPEELDRALAQLTGNSDITNLEWQRDHAEEMRAVTDQHAEVLSRLSATITRSPVGATLEMVAEWIEGQAPHNRVVIVDPVTMAMRTREPWVSDKIFLDRVKHAAERHGCSILLVSHLQKGAKEGDVDRLAGSACYERFSDTIIQLHRHESRTSIVGAPLGRMEVEHNQTVFVEKARAPGTGYRLAYSFAAGRKPGDTDGVLVFREHGVIVKR